MAANDTERAPSRVNRILGYATTATTAVLTALFIQKSDGNSAVETVFLLGAAAAGAFLVAATFASHVYLSDPQPHRLSWYLSKRPLAVVGGLVGVVLVVVSMARIDREDSDYSQPPLPHREDALGSRRMSTEIVADGESVTLRNLLVSDNLQAVRVVVSVVNTSKAPVVLSRASWTNAGPPLSDSCERAGQRYELDDDVNVDVTGKAHAELQAIEGPLAGFPVRANGVHHERCNGSQPGTHLEFPVAMVLDPLEATSLTIDVRKSVRVVRRGAVESAEGTRMPLEYVAADGWFTEVSVGYGTEGDPRAEASVCLTGSGSWFEKIGECTFAG